MPRTKQSRDVGRARQLRAEMSLPEVLLWQHLRNQPEGIKFRRQHPLGNYVLDFFCPAAKLCVEIDGEAHNLSDRPPRDEARDAWLRTKEIEVMRIAASDVLQSPVDVVEDLIRYCKG